MFGVNSGLSDLRSLVGCGGLLGGVCGMGVVWIWSLVWV